MKTQTKVIIRRLPKCLTKEQFLRAVHPYNKFNYFRFCDSNKSNIEISSTRVYIDFYSEDDLYQFKNEFDCKLFIDEDGNESYGLIEFAVFQGVSIGNKHDSKQNTMASDPDFIKFSEELNDVAKPDCIGTVETNLEEIKNRENDRLHITTPLIEYINNLPKKIKKDDYRKKYDYAKSIAKRDPENIIENGNANKMEIKCIKKNNARDISGNFKIESMKAGDVKPKVPRRNDIRSYATNYEANVAENDVYVDGRASKRGYGGYRGGGRQTSFDPQLDDVSKTTYYYNNGSRNDNYNRSYKDSYGYQQDYSQVSRPPGKGKRGGGGAGRRPPSYSASRKE